MRRYSSGQRGQTVNLLAPAYEGSNPSRRTKNPAEAGFFCGRASKACVEGFEEVVYIARSETSTI